MRGPRARTPDALALRGAAVLWLALGANVACTTPAPDAMAGPCASDADCKGRVCAPDPGGPADDLAPLELACVEPTAGAAPGQPCESGPDCANGLCLLAGACASACASAADCADGERCQRVFARSGPDALQPLSACVAHVDLPADAVVEARVLPDALTAGTDRLTLQTIDGPALYVLEHLDDDRWPYSERCRPPLCIEALGIAGDSPVTLWERTADTSSTPSRHPVATGSNVFVPTVWLTDGDALLSADDSLELRVTSEVPGDLRLTRLSRIPDRFGLDLNVFYVGARDWAPAASRGPPELEQALEEVDRILGQAELYIRDVRQIAVPGALPQTGNTFGEEGDQAQGFAHLHQRLGVLAELPALFALSAGAANSAVNLFFVADVDSTDGELEGLSGGVPGPAAMHGLGSSGIVFATDMMLGSPLTMGRTLAHEIAHYLGLFHTTEADGSAHDPLDDTPQCLRAQDLNSDGLLSAAECQDAGADNLMFWAKTDRTALSAGQIARLQQGLMLR